MATLSFLDAFGFSASGSLLPDARFLQVLPQFLHLQNVPLDQLQLSDVQANLTFKEPIAFSAPGLSLSIGAGAGGQIQVITSARHLIDSDDPFGPIKIAPAEIYIGVNLEFSASEGATLHTSPLAFGLALEQKVSVASYRRFFRSDTGLFPAFGPALARCFQAFVVPQSREDLEALDRDAVIVISGGGSLTFANSFEIATPVQQLAATSPVAGKTIEINASGSFTAGFTAALEGGYQTRLRRLESQEIEIGIYKSRARTLAIRLSAEAGLSANVGKFDLAEKFLGAISHNPIVDVSEFRQLLPGEDETARDLQIALFQKNLAAAVATSVQVSLDESISRLHSDESVLTFQFDLTSTNPPSTSSAITAALRGDFTAFTRSPTSLPPGIRQTSNVFTTTGVVKHKINVNLLGILNFVSMGKLARISEVTRNADGEITLVSDTADANHLQALLLNAAGNAKRLRAMLSEDFLFQATFKAVDLRVLPPEFTAKHTYIEITEDTDAQRMKDLLDICRAMDMLTVDEEAKRLQGQSEFGRTTFWLQAVYGSEAVDRIFLTPGGSPRSQEEFEGMGRQTLGQLLAGDPGQEFRKLIADQGPQGSTAWRRLKEIGNAASFNQVFGVQPGVADPRVSAAGADFLCIMAWAGAMKKLGEAIVEIRQTLASATSPDDNRLTSLRAKLRERMADVVSHSGEHFGDPLGLVTVYRASVSSSSARVILTGPAIPSLTATVGLALSSKSGDGVI